MKLKLLIISIVTILNFQNLSCMELFVWLHNKFGTSQNPSQNSNQNMGQDTGQNTESDINKVIKYIETDFDKIPKKEEILGARQALKKIGVVNQESRLKALEVLLNSQEIQTKQEAIELNYLEKAEYTVIANYSVKKPGQFRLDYLKVIQTISRALKNTELANPEIVYKIISNMPTLYSALKETGNLKETDQIILTQNGYICMGSYANLILDMQEWQNQNLGKKEKDTLLQILVGKVGGSVKLLELINKEIEDKAKSRAEKIVQLEDDLESTTKNFEQAKAIKSGAVIVWALIFKHIKQLKSN